MTHGYRGFKRARTALGAVGGAVLGLAFAATAVAAPAHDDAKPGDGNYPISLSDVRFSPDRIVLAREGDKAVTHLSGLLESHLEEGRELGDTYVVVEFADGTGKVLSAEEVEFGKDNKFDHELTVDKAGKYKATVSLVSQGVVPEGEVPEKPEGEKPGGETEKPEGEKPGGETEKPDEDALVVKALDEYGISGTATPEHFIYFYEDEVDPDHFYGNTVVEDDGVWVYNWPVAKTVGTTIVVVERAEQSQDAEALATVKVVIGEDDTDEPLAEAARLPLATFTDVNDDTVQVDEGDEPTEPGDDENGEGEEGDEPTEPGDGENGEDGEGTEEPGDGENGEETEKPEGEKPGGEEGEGTEEPGDGENGEETEKPEGEKPGGEEGGETEKPEGEKPGGEEGAYPGYKVVQVVEVPLTVETAAGVTAPGAGAGSGGHGSSLAVTGAVVGGALLAGVGSVSGGTYLYRRSMKRA